MRLKVPLVLAALLCVPGAARAQSKIDLELSPFGGGAFFLHDGPGAVAVSSYINGWDETDLTDAQLAQIEQDWIDQKPLNAFYWSGEYTDLCPAVQDGTIWVAYAWQGCYATALAAGDPVVRRLGTAMLLLALQPSAAFAVGLGRAARRALRGEHSADAPLAWLTAALISAYALYTARNPWFAVVKGTALLGLGLPFAFFASEMLADWARPERRGAPLVVAALVALAALAAAGFSFGLCFPTPASPGLPWRAALGGGLPNPPL